MQKQNKGKSNRQRIQVGTSSLLLIFTVLCLVVFATLSLSSARVDYGLALKNEKSVQAYYDADGKGEELKRDVNNTLIALRGGTSGEADFKAALKKEFKTAYDDEKNCITYNVDAGSEQFLFVELKLGGYNDVESEKENFEILSWVIRNNEDYEIDESMNVWSGGSL